MKKFDRGPINAGQLIGYFSRRNCEIASLILILIASLSVFTSKMAHQETIQLDTGNLQYKGAIVAHKMNGKGTLTFKNGDVYEGHFVNGSFNGKGTYKSAKGWVYVGEFKNGYADGKGKLTTETQISYEGRFKQGIYQHAD